MEKADIVRIESAIELLKAISVREDALQIEAESSFHEAVILGTPDAYLKAALFFLQMAKSPEDTEDADLIDFFSEWGACWPVCGYVLKDAASVQEAAKKFQCPS